MSNVWKIGSRWGYPGTSILDVFLSYNCVFFNTDETSKIGDYMSVKNGDLFIIADGETPVAIAKALDSFKKYEESGLLFTSQDKDEYIYEKVLLCKVSIILLEKEERKTWGFMNQNRFCAYRPHDLAQRELVFKYWEEHQSKNEHGVFDIVCGTYSLLENTKDKPAILTQYRQYQIPIYQRPYSWGENNLRRLIEDLRDAVKNGEPVFMGTMQLSEPIPLDPYGKKNAYDIIDGQQRISSFIILLGLLGILPDYVKRIRTLVNRGKAQDDLDVFWKTLDNWTEFKRLQQDYIHNTYLRNAVTVDILLNEMFDGNEENPSRDELRVFLKEKILFVVIETHASLSKTLKIFNTINTAGLDLGAEDLFKIRFYEYLKLCGESDEVFNRISDIYARVAQGKKEQRLGTPNMEDLLSTYQRVLVVKYDLPVEAFNMGYERFYDQLFDTLLNVREWPQFKKTKEDKSGFKMSVDDLSRLMDCFETNGEILSNNWDYRIINCFLWETRYGGTIWNYNVIALFLKAINKDQLHEYTTLLFKLLCPPSLYYAKSIYAIRSLLIDELKKEAKNENYKGVETLLGCFKTWAAYGTNMETMLQQSFENQIAFYPKWKYLICRLIEYLKSSNKDEMLFRRLWSSIDIEHIQCFTDEKDADGIQKEWGEELNRLGNLVLLESSINRSINNRTEAKPAGYHESHFESVKELEKQVGIDANGQSKWKKDDAINRRKNNTTLLTNYIFGCKI